MFDLTLARAADVVRRNQSPYTATRSANGHERRALCIVAGVACLAVISAALQVVVDDADTPWLGASAESAGAPALRPQRTGRRWISTIDDRASG